MKKLIKWLLVISIVCVLLVVVLVLAAPRLIDVQQYKPRIEELITRHTGRPVTLGKDMDLSLFPWVGIRISDVHIGNPEGFSQKDMASIGSFEIRVKVMPLLSRKIEVKTFVVDKPVIHLEKPATGPANWEGMGRGKQAGDSKPRHGAPEDDSRKGGMPVEALTIQNFAVTGGRVTWVDHALNRTVEITDMSLVLDDVSFDTPLKIDFSAVVNNQPVALKGSVGPTGDVPGKGRIPVNLTLDAMDMLQVKLDGHVTDPAVQPVFDFVLAVSPFSPRKLMTALGRPFPVETADSSVPGLLAADLRINGTPEAFTLSDGRMTLDDSGIKFEGTVADVQKPDIRFTMALDRIDLDRYLPPPGKEQADAGPIAEKSPGGGMDYTALRKLVLDGEITVEKLLVKKLAVDDIRIKIDAKEGILSVDPFACNLSQGTVAAKASMDVNRKEPATAVKLRMEGIQAAPLVQALVEKEIIEGTLAADADMRFTGDTPDRIRQTLEGRKELLFTDGAIVGVDLTNIMHTVKSRAGMQSDSEKKPRTDFASLLLPVDIKDGIASIDGSEMVSPLLRLNADGKVDIIEETVDVKITPKIVGTLKGQGDKKERTGILVPVLVTGPLTQPKFRPDMAGITGQELPDAEGIKDIVGDKETREKQIEDVKEDAKSMLKDLFPSQ